MRAAVYEAFKRVLKNRGRAKPTVIDGYGKFPFLNRNLSLIHISLAMVMNIMMILTRPYSAGLRSRARMMAITNWIPWAPPFSKIFQNRPFRTLFFISVSAKS